MHPLKPCLAAIHEFLSAEGYRPEADADGDLTFRADGLNFLFVTEATDPHYARLTLPAIWCLETPTDVQVVRRVVDELNRELKLIKVYVLDEAIWLSVEMLCPDIRQWMDYLPRLIETLVRATRRLAESIHDLKHSKATH